jgi:hypothetical protein
MCAEAENNPAHMTANFDPGFYIHTNDEGRISDLSLLLHKFRENHTWQSLRMASGACAKELPQDHFSLSCLLCVCAPSGKLTATFLLHRLGSIRWEGVAKLLS